MPSSQAFDITFDEQIYEHLGAIDSKYDAFIQDTLEQQLRYEPNTGTRNRKQLRLPAPFGATWELRCGPNNRFRIYYDVNVEEQIVVVLAVGVKVGNVLRIGKEEYVT